MDNPKTEVINAIKEAQNVLVTVSKDPSVDQLSAAIGMTLVLNKLGKHGTAVFSGTAPSTIEFLKPEETLEKNTDSLRDFIISLDKSKADKLRYKVEDQHVKIFITPYRTNLGESDLIFSHGDFNVDVVLALGVHEQNELDQAITAHGRILHDAKIVTVNVGKPGQLGGVNLNEDASSLSEVMAQMSLSIKNDVFDEQIATALLTGIVAETDRFSNEKTKPDTMSLSAKLMAAGANQQLVATKLQVQPEPPEPEPQEEPNLEPGAQESEDSVKHTDGSLEIKHKDEPEPANEPEEEPNPNLVHVDDDGNFKSVHAEDELPPIQKEERRKFEPSNSNEPQKRKRMILEPPTSGNKLTASGSEEEDPSTDPLSNPDHSGPILSHEKSSKVTEDSKQEPESTQLESLDSSTDKSEPKPQPDESSSEPNLPEPAPQQVDTDQFEDQTLESLEKSVDSPHQEDQPSVDAIQSNDDAPKEPKPESTQAPDIDQLQNAVDAALSKADSQKPLDPIAALNANPVDLDLGHEGDAVKPSEDEGYLDVSQLDETTGLPQNEQEPATEKPMFPPESTPGPSTDSAGPATPPPPVPPPMMPPSSDDGPALPPVNS